MEREMTFDFYSVKPPCQYFINNPLLAVDIYAGNAKTRFSTAESRLFNATQTKATLYLIYIPVLVSAANL